MDSQKYVKTGRNVSVSKDELIREAINMLAEYDSMTEEERNENDSNNRNPYHDVIFITLNNGKTIQVPRQIQLESIDMWIQNRNKQLHNDTSHTRIARRERYSKQDPYVMDPNVRASQRRVSTENDARNFRNVRRVKNPRIQTSRETLATSSRTRPRTASSPVKYNRINREEGFTADEFNDLPRDYIKFNGKMRKELNETDLFINSEVFDQSPKQDISEDNTEDVEDILYPYDEYENCDDCYNLLSNDRKTILEVNDETYPTEKNNQEEDCKTCNLNTVHDVNVENNYDPMFDYRKRSVDNYNGYNSNVVRSQSQNIETMEGKQIKKYEDNDYEDYDDETKKTYKYMFYGLVLIILLMLIYHYKKNGNRFNF
jgi:hypothetical protein